MPIGTFETLNNFEFVNLTYFEPTKHCNRKKAWYELNLVAHGENGKILFVGCVFIFKFKLP